MSYLLWTSKSTRTLAEEFVCQGYAVSRFTVAVLSARTELLVAGKREDDRGYPTPRSREAVSAPQRASPTFGRHHDPVVSVDTKKKELVRSFEHRGRRWQLAGDPEEVNVHDFPA